MATSNDIQNGSIIKDGNNLWLVVEFQHVKPGKGGAFVRTKQKNVMTGKVVEKTYNAGASLEFTKVNRQKMQYSYNDGGDFVFMNTTTYEQVTVPAAIVGDDRRYLTEGETLVDVADHDGDTLFIDLPPSVIVEIKYTEPGLQGDRSNAGTKPATFENNGEDWEVQVPLFIEIGEKIIVDTRTNEFKERAKK
jgi:elongation factor P